EKVMTNIWNEILGFERIGVHDNFFDLGGHSLLSMQLVSQVGKIFQIELPLQIFFESPTIASLAQVIDTARQQGSAAVMPDRQATDFNAEAVLDQTIYSETTPGIQKAAEPVSVFLTGATGFLGAFLLHELLLQTRADIYCLVRSANIEEGRKRIQNTLESYSLWNEYLSPR
ncbi:MAG: non-ribosomal peptide synthetase, partial [Proteobacteria bacterium]|nr:non-ribosomal peptide synthetase [Pseudomonadota bacterium]